MYICIGDACQFEDNISIDLARLHKKYLTDGSFHSLPSEIASYIYKEMMNNDKILIIGYYSKENKSFIGGVVISLEKSRVLSNVKFKDKVIVCIKIMSELSVNPFKYLDLIQIGWKKKYPYIEAIYVDKSKRSKGIGSQLILAASKHVGHNFYVDTRKHNLSAIKFYTQLGFQRLPGTILSERFLSQS
jgi:ribosomal protein S18 acetylase RimI-like enzyme